MLWEKSIMSTERFRLLAGVVAAHPDRSVHGRTRLQKTVRLLQRMGFPTDYDYTLHFYGPYSEGLHAETRLLERLGLVKEEMNLNEDGTPYYILTASEDADIPDGVDPFRQDIERMSRAKPVTLELAATYDAFRELRYGHDEALERLRLKKRAKCNPQTERDALELLKELGIPAGV